MSTFKDQNNREWAIRIDGPKLREVRQALSLNLCDPGDFHQLSDDVVLLVDVLWVLCRGQYEGVTDVQFGQALVGDVIEVASVALVDAMSDFFPTRQRSLLRALAAKQQQMREAGANLVQRKLTDPAMLSQYLENLEMRLDRDIQKFLTGPNNATSGPESSESDPKA